MNNYIKYAGMGFQMLVIIGGLTYLGHYLDGKWSFATPWMTISLALFGIVASTYQIIKQLTK
ncbi:MAG: AtpZ/AtpI family protein [Sphingobacteriales bacterium]|nr:AtpZ/AtpI family protein [Sphingobacteriales bacterium]